VYALPKKAAAEVVRLAAMRGVATAEGFLRLKRPLRRNIVELATMRGGTHPLKEAHIALEAGLNGLTGEKPSEYWNEARDLLIDAENALGAYLAMLGFDVVGSVPPQLREAEDNVVLGLAPTSRRKQCRPDACACDMSYQDNV
jgi:hypothetical protein